MSTIDLVVTRHPALVQLLIDRGLTTAETPVIAHATARDVRGRVVAGVLPMALAAECARVIEIPLSVSRQDRGRELTIEELRSCAGPAVEYSVCRVEEIPPLDLDAMETSRQLAQAQRSDVESEAVALARARALAAIDDGY